MALKVFNAELDRFLQSSEPEVLCVTGKWGVGKTYAWRHRFKAAQSNKRINLARHSYVSLFGRNSLDDVRTAIAENTKDSTDLDTKPSVNSLKIVMGRISPIVSALTKAASYIPGATNHVATINRALYLTVRDQIVCVDDLERAGSGLEMKTVLGLALSLKEERGCKVVILLNQGALKGDREKDFSEQLEKVADVVIAFQPTAKEAAELVISGNAELDVWLSSNVQTLGIVNIRVIHKAEAACKRMLSILANADQRIKKQAVHTITLAVFSKFQPEEAPPLSLVKTFNSFSDYLGSQRAKEPDPNERHKATLRRYEFTNADGFDQLLIQGVESGTFDADTLTSFASEVQKRLLTQDQNRCFEESWSAFHELIRRQPGRGSGYDVSRTHIEHKCRQCTQLSSTVSFLKEFGREHQAQEALALFMHHRDAAPAFWDLSHHPFAGHVTDEDVRNAFAEKLKAVTVRPKPIELLSAISDRNGWNPEDVTQLATQTAEDFVKLFKSLRGDELTRAINAGLRFREISNADDEMKHVVATVETAIRMIGKESVMNARRIRRYGVELDSPSASHMDDADAGAITP